MRNITLRNVYSEGGVLPPGIIRCNETNPCTDFTFENVQMKGWFNYLNKGFITENVYGTVINSHPDPHFKLANQTSSEINSYENDFAAKFLDVEGTWLDEFLY
jgi:hypothetical protein